MTIEAIASSDFSGLTQLNTKKKDEALPLVAKQFEALFLQSMLKSMRMSQHFLEESSPFRSKDHDTFEEMLDAQYVSNIANGPRGIGLAQMLTQQLEQKPPAQLQPITTTTVLSQDAPISPSLEKPEDELIQSIWPIAKQAASVIGLDPKILLAQTMLETGWGKFINKTPEGESSHNLFNIKATHPKEPAVNVKTTEYIANTPIKTNASFKKYASYEQSFQDYIALVQNNDRYQEALAATNNPEKYVQALHQAGYATDPRYSEKIMAIYQGNELKESLKRCGLESS